MVPGCVCIHGPYLDSLLTSRGNGHAFIIWSIFPQLEHRSGNISYLKLTQDWFLSSLFIIQPGLRGLLVSTETLMWINFCICAFSSTSSTWISCPMNPPILVAFCTFILFIGKLWTWTQKVQVEKSISSRGRWGDHLIIYKTDPLTAEGPLDSTLSLSSTYEMYKKLYSYPAW